MKSIASRSLGLLLTSAVLIAAPVQTQAEVIKVPIAQQGETSDITLPKKGTLKSEVLEKHGEPLAKTEPVGEPPISQWKYDGYTVYFEYDHVIHGVIHPKKTP